MSDSFGEHADELLEKDQSLKRLTQARRAIEPAIVRARARLDVVDSSFPSMSRSSDVAIRDENDSLPNTEAAVIAQGLVQDILDIVTMSDPEETVVVKTEPAAPDEILEKLLLAMQNMQPKSDRTDRAPSNAARAPVPKYVGAKHENVRTFLTSLSDWFDICRITQDADKLKYMSVSLSGHALTWFQSARETAKWSTFAAFETAFLDQWSAQAATTHQLVDSLSSYRQRYGKDTVDDWYQFVISTTLALRAQGAVIFADPLIALHNFVRGLRDDIRDHIRTLQLTHPDMSMEQVLRHARQKEIEVSSRNGRRDRHVAHVPRGQGTSSGRSRPAAGSGTRGDPIIINGVEYRAKKGSRPNRAKPEMTERQKELLAAGKCFTCEQPGHRARDCPAAKTLK